MPETATASKPQTIFLGEEFDRFAEAKGLRTMRQKADFLRVHVGTYCKIRNGDQPPGPRFIAAVKLAAPECNIEQFFHFAFESDGAATTPQAA